MLPIRLNEDDPRWNQCQVPSGFCWNLEIIFLSSEGSSEVPLFPRIQQILVVLLIKIKCW